MRPELFHYFGLIKGLLKVLRLADVSRSAFFNLLVSIDGLPLEKSTCSQFWTITRRAYNSDGIDTEVFDAGLYWGNEKPSDSNLLMRKFVDELNILLSDGIVVKGRRLNVQHCGFICDAPARAFLKKIKFNSGYSSCPKCHVVGNYAITNRARMLQRHPKGRAVFLEIDALPRTDDLFRDGLDEDRHSGESILEELDIDMVQDFPHEHLHLTGLGVGRKLVQTATINPEFKLSNVKIQRLDSHTKKIKEYCPRDFPRKPRSVKLSARWKATEFTTFDAYTGPVLFLNILRPEQYHHFLAYSVAIRILSTPGLCTEVESNTFAHKFLVNFVQNSVILYGESFVSFNVHGLIHLAADIMRFGPLMDFSAFPFENHLQGMKKTIRKSQKPLHQYVRRVKEFELNQIANEDEGQEEWFIFKKQHYTGPVLQNFDEGNQFKQAFIGKRFLSRVRDDKANCCVLLNDNSVVVIENFLLDRNKKPHITGKTFTDPSDFLILLLFRLNLRFYKFIRFRNCQKCPKFGR